MLEATFGWGWLADELLAAGLDPHLASSRKVAAWRQARGMAKSNRTDADLLSELWSQQPRWWEVWLAPPEVRDRREWLRYRMALVTMQTALKCRIHAVLHRHGIVHGYSDLFGTAGRAFLNLLVAPNDETLRRSAKATLKIVSTVSEKARQTLRSFLSTSSILAISCRTRPLAITRRSHQRGCRLTPPTHALDLRARLRRRL